MCKGLSGSSMSDADILAGISAGLNVYYNYTGDTPCFNISVDADAVLGARGWYYQVRPCMIEYLKKITFSAVCSDLLVLLIT